MPDHRGSGVGESLTRMLLDQAREAGAGEMVLEVIVENAPAIALYEKLGFARTRKFEVLTLAAATEHSGARETELDRRVDELAAQHLAEVERAADAALVLLQRRSQW